MTLSTSTGSEFQDYQTSIDKFIKENFFKNSAEGLHRNMTASMMDQTIQSYMSDAIRNVEVKIFKATIFLKDNKKIKIFFTNRFELGYAPSKGAGSVYNKLESLRNILNSTSEKDLMEKY